MPPMTHMSRSPHTHADVRPPSRDKTLQNIRVGCCMPYPPFTYILRRLSIYVTDPNGTKLREFGMLPTLGRAPRNQGWKLMKAALAQSALLLNRGPLPTKCPFARAPGKIRTTSE